VVREELAKELSALPSQNTTSDFRTVVEPTVPYDVPKRPDRAGLDVVCAEHQSGDASQHHRAGTHGARLESDSQGAAVKPPGTKPTSSGPERKDLRMRGGVVVRLARVGRTPQLRTVRPDNEGAHRDVPRTRHLLRHRQRTTYQGDVRLDNGWASRHLGERRVEHLVELLSEPESRSDVAEQVVGVAVGLVAECSKGGGREAEVGDDAQVTGRLDLVVVIVGKGQLQALHHGAGERRLGRSANVGQQQPHVPSRHPDDKEEVVVDAHHPQGPYF
jgi:hypothetical protein